MTEQTMVKLTGLYENRSKAGQVYFIGYLGACKVLVLKDMYATDGEPGWALLVSPRPEPAPTRPSARTRRLPEWRVKGRLSLLIIASGRVDVWMFSSCFRSLERCRPSDFAGNDEICLGCSSNRINVGSEVRPGRAGPTPILRGKTGQKGSANSGREPLVPVSPATVRRGRVARTLDAAVAAFDARPLKDRYRVLMLDGVGLGRKTGAGGVRRPVLVALRLRSDGSEEIIDFRLAVAESTAQWERRHRSLPPRHRRQPPEAGRCYVYSGRGRGPRGPWSCTFCVRHAPCA